MRHASEARVAETNVSAISLPHTTRPCIERRGQSGQCTRSEVVKTLITPLLVAFLPRPQFQSPVHTPSASREAAALWDFDPASDRCRSNHDGLHDLDLSGPRGALQSSAISDMAAPTLRAKDDQSSRSKLPLFARPAKLRSNCFGHLFSSSQRVERL
jgi:hypothetical protein